MGKPRSSHAPGPRGTLCGARIDGHAQRCPSFMTPSCKRCVALRSRQRVAYVTMARHLLEQRRRPVSAGEVAYHVHGHATHALETLSLEAEQALSEAGFRRASWINGGRFGDISLWRTA